jgi:hypothetical protein
MKSTKIFALIVSTIAMFPSASWADEMSINQEIKMNSTTTGNGRVTSIETNQQDIQLPQSGRYSRKSTRTIYHKINNRATSSIGTTAASRKRFKQQLLDKIMQQQIIKQHTQNDD